jgi:NADPH-dependent 2,4-dienoyl-CoA reductase/sulfur reductase-like enzyme
MQRREFFKAGAIVAVGLNRRGNDAYQALKKEIATGKYGTFRTGRIFDIITSSMNRRDFLKFASAAPFAGVAAEPCVATEVGECCDYNVDVLVVGGGPAGVCAAISAARNGAKTMVVEQSGMLGGMATQGVFLG